MRNNTLKGGIATGGESITSDRKFRSSAAGKVVLAAIVHQQDTDLLLGYRADSVSPSCESSTTLTKSPADYIEKKKGKLSLLEAGKKCKLTGKQRADKTDRSSGKQKEDKSGGCKFSRLFSKKKQTTGLIDRAHLTLGQDKLTAQNNDADEDDDDRVEKDELPSGDNKQAPSDYENKSAQSTGGNLNKSNNSELKGIDKEQVIEFKFDLIVECNRLRPSELDETLDQIKDSAGSRLSEGANQLKPEHSWQLAANCKLVDNINELLESFVLDSADLCIMSAGKQLSAAHLNNRYHSDGRSSLASQLEKLSNGGNQLTMAMEEERDDALGGEEKSADEFDYLNQLVAHSLARSFHLLSLNKQQTANNKHRANEEHSFQVKLKTGGRDEHECRLRDEEDIVVVVGEGNKFRRKNHYSIEISATLFLNEPPHSTKNQTLIASEGDTAAQADSLPPTQQVGNLSILDLLSEATTAAMTDTSDACWSSMSTSDSGELTLTADNELSGIFNESARQALSKPTPFNPTCLDCPNLESALDVLKVIKNKLKRLKLRGPTDKEGEVEANGFARTNKLLLVGLKLKQQFNGGLFSNRMCLIDFDQNFAELHPILESIFNGQALAYLKRHKIHLNALEESLRETSRSIKTSVSGGALKKQHHQVAWHEKLMQAEWLLYKQLSSALIRTLIIVHVRKLATPKVSIQNEISERRRDFRNLERHLMCENLLLLEFARSMQHASATRLKRRKRHLKSHLMSSNLSVASNASASSTIARNLDPLRSPLFRTRRQLARPAETAMFLSGDRKASMDANLTLARHHHRHKITEELTCQQLHHRSLHHRNHHTVHQSRASVARQHSDFTESSSLSTSSGSQTNQIRSSKSPRAGPYQHFHQHHHHQRQHEPNNFSDSDSVTSANLNSCSSSSYNRLVSSPQRVTTRSRHRRDIELKWLTKQAERAGQNGARDQERGLLNQIELVALNSLPTSRRSSSSSRLMTPQRRESNVIQIDCEPIRRVGSHLDSYERGSDIERDCKNDSQQMSDKTGEEQVELEDPLSEGINLDNISDVCSLVAEPPKQLKLEEFLSQLSCSMIAPKTSAEKSILDHSQRLSPSSQAQLSNLDGTSKGVTMFSGQHNTGDYVRSPFDTQVSNTGSFNLNEAYTDVIQSTNGLHNRSAPVRLVSHNDIENNGLTVNGGNQMEEDDEDCKSHSSILEHLSSLALESNSRLNNRQQRCQAQKQPANSMIGCKQTHPPERDLDFNFDLNLTLQSPIDSPLMLEIDRDNSHQVLSTQNGLDHNSTNDRTAHNTGQLQKLLNNSFQIKKSNQRVIVKDSNSVGDRLRALSISCQTTPAALPSSASPSSGSSGTFISSDGSICCSSSSSSNETKLSDQHNEASQTAISNRDLYANITRKVKT